MVNITFRGVEMKEIEKLKIPQIIHCDPNDTNICDVWEQLIKTQYKINDLVEAVNELTKSRNKR